MELVEIIKNVFSTSLLFLALDICTINVLKDEKELPAWLTLIAVIVFCVSALSLFGSSLMMIWIK